jgi:hypothetical protein
MVWNLLGLCYVLFPTKVDIIFPTAALETSRTESIQEGQTTMTPNVDQPPASLFVPGDVLALLSSIQDIEPGLYLLDAITEGWAVLRWLIDDEATERIMVTNHEVTLPVVLLQLFVSVGLRMTGVV